VRISELGEFGLIRRLARILGSDKIGDDCAFIEQNGKFFVLTTDALVEGVHFLKNINPETLGWKAISVNVSDSVAGGGKPRWVLVSLIIPDRGVSWVERLYAGIKSACDFYECEVVGGNVARGEKVVIDVFLVGETEKPLRRAGAKPGEGLFVSGTLGDSRAGLELLKEGRGDYKPYELALIERHTRPTARIDYLTHLRKYASACVDISDGLLMDAGHLAERSGVKIEIDSSKLPLSDELRRYCEERGKDPLEYALKGGEDYQLLFCHPASRQNPFMDMTLIGEVLEGEGVWVDGLRTEGGFSHF
jgi:thiamine-monophosphate kinase